MDLYIKKNLTAISKRHFKMPNKRTYKIDNKKNGGKKLDRPQEETSKLF